MVTSIGSNIKRFRNQKKMTQKQLAEKAGITLFTLAKIESGATADPRIETVKSISKVLLISLDELTK